MDPEPSYEVRFADPAEPPLLDGEEWRTVDANGAAVSSHGRYRNSRGVVNTPTPARSGYVSVTISGKSTSMHRAVAEAFGLPGQSAERCQVNHTDGDRSNNRLENLEWVSAAENVKHSHDTNAQRRQCGPRQSKPVEARRLGTDKWVRFASTAEAAQALGLSSDCVSSCARGRQQRCGDYELRFADPTEPSMLDGEEWRAVGREVRQCRAAGDIAIVVEWFVRLGQSGVDTSLSALHTRCASSTVSSQRRSIYLAAQRSETRSTTSTATQVTTI